MIVHNRDGSISVTAYNGVSQIISSGLSDAERDAAIAAFFAQHASEPPPDEVAMWKAKAVLHAAGQLETVNAAVAQQSVAIQLAWAQAATIHRGSPAIALVASLLGYSSGQLDDWFRQADALTL